MKMKTKTDSQEKCESALSDVHKASLEVAKIWLDSIPDDQFFNEYQEIEKRLKN